MTRSIINIKILDELKSFIVPLAQDEFAQLEKSILNEGCRDSLIVWEQNEEHILVDGHNRYKICVDNNIHFDILIMDFENLEDVRLWMLNNQIGRRNLSPDQLSYYRGLKYLSLRNKKGGYDNVLSKGQNELSTSEMLAEEFRLSESTIKRDAKFAEGLNIIGNKNNTLKSRILKGEVKVNKKDIQMLTNVDDFNFTLKNEIDIFNIAKSIRNRVLNQIESKINDVYNRSLEDAQEILIEKEPLFPDKSDRLQKIKGRIISAINRAIVKKDLNAIGDLKNLIEQLELLLTDD